MQTLGQIQQLKALGDPQRLAILRRLMDRPATLSQLGDHFGESPAHIRHHLKALEQVGLVELSSTHPVRGFLEKYYRASQSAYLIQLAILPETVAERATPILGSNDPALQEMLAQQNPAQGDPLCALLGLDSLEGLVKLREGVCEMATLHLLDEQSGEYNRPYVRHHFPGERMALIHLYAREEGLLVREGNPLAIRGIADFTRPGLRMVNREPGSGTRVWLDHALDGLGVSGAALPGYDFVVHSHLEVARAVAEGRADAGIGLPTGAARYGLSYIPLFEEPYDLILAEKNLASARFTPLLDYLNAGAFLAEVQRFAGYHAQRASGQVAIVH